MKTKIEIYSKVYDELSTSLSGVRSAGMTAEWNGELDLLSSITEVDNKLGTLLLALKMKIEALNQEVKA